MIHVSTAGTSSVEGPSCLSISLGFRCLSLHMGTVHCSRCALRSHHVWQLQRLDLKGESLHVRDACEQCGNVVGGRPLVFVRIFSWSFVHLTRHCVDCDGYGLKSIVTFQQHDLCVVPFVVHASVWVIPQKKTVGASGVPSMQDVEKALPATRLLAGRSQLSVCCHSASFKKCSRNCPESCLYHGWTMFGSAFSLVSGRNRPIECVCGPS